MASLAAGEKVDFWFDPSCPWTWITSRWITEVATELPLSLTMHAFSLCHLNRDKDIPQSYREHLESARLGAEVAAGVEKLAPARLTDFYTALGTRHFVEEALKDAATARAALQECGLPEEIVDRAAAGEFTDYLADSTKKALALVGEDVGVPIIATAGVAFFGPVISPAPHGDAAIKLWEGALALAETPGFFELKRSRTTGPIFS